MSTKRKKLVFLWSTSHGGMGQAHLDKDTFWTPYVLGKKLDYDVEIVYYSQEGKPAMQSEYLGVTLTGLHGDNLDELCVDYIKNHAKDIDFLMMVHFSRKNLRLASLYKKGNKNGFCYIKLDATAKRGKTSPLKDFVKRLMSAYFTRHVDVFSIETKSVHEEVLKYGKEGYHVGRKLHLVPNGITNLATSFARRSFDQKENLIISVGRIGMVPKNNEKLLYALPKVDLKNWKVAFVGPFTDEFKLKFDAALAENPKLKDMVELTGPIWDKDKLFDFYDRAKVFVLTSDSESFGLVLTEALHFGNYIVTTDVGGAQAVTDDYRIGQKIASCEDLAKALQACIDEEVLSEALHHEIVTHAKKFQWDNLLDVVYQKFLEHQKKRGVGGL